MGSACKRSYGFRHPINVRQPASRGALQMTFKNRNFKSNNTAEAIGGALSSAVSTAEDALDTAKETLHNTSDRVQQMAENLCSKGSDLVHQASDLAIQARYSLHKARLRTRLYVAENPAKTIAIAAGVAFVGGLVLGF